MPTDNELELPKPLDSPEIKHAIAHKVAEAVFDALDKYGPLYGKSFPKFKVSGTLHLILDNFGLTSESNHGLQIAEPADFFPAPDAENLEVAIDIPETPPNQLRRETEQPVPTAVRENGKQTEKAVLYQPKRKYTRRAQ